MTTICQNCHTHIRGSGQPISHGLCINCWMLFYPDSFPLALMPPKATRLDCVQCIYLDADSDGVPDGCNLLVGEKCIAPGKRGPWL